MPTILSSISFKIPLSTTALWEPSGEMNKSTIIIRAYMKRIGLVTISVLLGIGIFALSLQGCKNKKKSY